MKYCFLIITILFTQVIANAQFRPISLLETTNNGTTAKYTILYDANGNVEAFSNNLDYTEFYYDDVSDNVKRIKRATVYKNAQMRRAFALQYNEAGQVSNIVVIDSLFNGSTKFVKIDTAFNINVTYYKNTIATMQTDETIWYYDKFKVVPSFSIMPLQKKEENLYNFEKRSLIQDGSKSYNLNSKCANAYIVNNNLAYFLFLIGNMQSIQYNVDILMYSALQNIQIQEISYAGEGFKDQPLFNFSQEAFAFDNKFLLKNASIDFTKRIEVNNKLENKIYTNKITIVYESPNFDYAKAAIVCDEILPTIEDKPIKIDNPKMKPVKKLIVKPTIPIKPKTTPKKEVIIKKGKEVKI
jgi:hypothetical protein